MTRPTTARTRYPSGGARRACRSPASAGAWHAPHPPSAATSFAVAVAVAASRASATLQPWYEPTTRPSTIAKDKTIIAKVRR
jgi:hypothetical protein